MLGFTSDQKYPSSINPVAYFSLSPAASAARNFLFSYGSAYPDDFFASDWDIPIPKANFWPF